MSIEHSPQGERTADIVYMTDLARDSQRSLTPDQVTYWRGEAAEAEIRSEELQIALNYEMARRAYALSMLGMI